MKHSQVGLAQESVAGDAAGSGFRQQHFFVCFFCISQLILTLARRLHSDLMAQERATLGFALA